MPWVAGQTGNPNGRPKGKRDQIGRKLLTDLNRYWQKYGEKAIQDAHEHNPAKFLQIVASLLPRDATLTLNVSNEFIEALKVINARGRLGEGVGPLLLGRAEVRDGVLESDPGALAIDGADDD